MSRLLLHCLAFVCFCRMFCLVIGTEESGADFEATVPFSWINEATKCIYWPNARFPGKLVENKSPPQPSWRQYPLKRVKHRSGNMWWCWTFINIWINSNIYNVHFHVVIMRIGSLSRSKRFFLQIATMSVRLRINRRWRGKPSCRCRRKLSCRRRRRRGMRQKLKMKTLYPVGPSITTYT